MASIIATPLGLPAKGLERILLWAWSVEACAKVMICHCEEAEVAACGEALARLVGRVRDFLHQPELDDLARRIMAQALLERGTDDEGQEIPKLVCGVLYAHEADPGWRCTIEKAIGDWSHFLRNGTALSSWRSVDLRPLLD